MKHILDIFPGLGDFFSFFLMGGGGPSVVGHTADPLL